MLQKNKISSFRFLLFTILIFSMLSCKKGADDPTISLKTRYARLKGNWKLSNFEETKKNINVSYLSANNLISKNLDSTITNEFFDGANWKTTIINTNQPTGNPQVRTIKTYNRAFSFEMIIDEANIFTKNSQGAGSAQQEIDGIITNQLSWEKTTVLEEKGTWYWDNSQKSKYGIKSNMGMLICIPFVTPFTPYQEYPIEGDLTKLSNNELIITYQYISKQKLDYAETEWAVYGNSEINILRKFTFKKNK